ncbi:hypothetical protein AB5I41_08110 [Sphingomonas sp. MMS24-JH45]
MNSKLGTIVVHGHSVHVAGYPPESDLGIDSGAYRTGRLTAIGVEDGQFWPLMTSPSAPPDRVEAAVHEQFFGAR